MKLAGLVILYHPQQNVIKNILTYYHFVERLYIFDNTESHSSADLFSEFEKATFFYDGKNQGIAQRLNEGCKIASAEGFQWLLTMDQDSCFPEGTLPQYLQCVEQYEHKGNVAVFGTQYAEESMPSLSACMAEETKFIMTSGTIVNIDLYHVLGGFDEDLFIDSVDHEYCLRANSKNFQTIQFTNILLHHLVGSRSYKSSFKTLYLKKKLKTVHPPLRCYYLLRNMMYLTSKYEKLFPEFISHNKKVVNLHLSWSFWYGGKAWQTMWHMRQAIKDFKKGKMGKKVYESA